MADFLARSVFVQGERDHGFLFVLLARMDLRPNLSRPSTVRAQEDLQEDIASWVLPIVCCNWDSLPYLYCARMDRRAKPTPIMLQLPRDVVQNIFSVKPSGSDQPVLSLQDRVRALAVCRAWKALLDPTLWPIEVLNLKGSRETDRRIASWICTTQPAIRCLSLGAFQPALLFVTMSSISPRTALGGLSLFGQASLLLNSLAAVCLFPRLGVLNLLVTPGSQGHLDLAALQPLVVLAHLVCGGWERVELRDTTALPQLSSMEFEVVDSLEIDTALPRLQRLDINDAESVRLAGEHLQLPQLSQLSFKHALVVTVDWRAMPQLAELSVVRCEDVTITGLAALGRLTSLTMGWCHESWQSAHSVLQAAPPALRHLSCHVRGPSTLREDDWFPMPVLASLQQLSSLVCRSPAIILDLGPQMQLQHLEFPWHSLMDLHVQHLDMLYRLTTLRRLEFGASVEESVARHRLEVLKKVLPGSCTLRQLLH